MFKLASEKLYTLFHDVNLIETTMSVKKFRLKILVKNSAKKFRLKILVKNYVKKIC